MFNRIFGFAFFLLLLHAAAGFAQSIGTQTVNIPQGGTLSLRANSVDGVTFQWLKDRAMINGGTTTTYTVTEPGRYSVISYNTLGCASDISEEVLVTTDPTATLYADVLIIKGSDLKAININESFEYLLQVKNSGPDQATQVKVEDKLPDVLKFESLTNPQIGTASYNETTKTVLWEIDRLDLGQQSELKIKVIALRPGVIRNTATVKANESDPVLANNTSTDIKTVKGIIIPNVFTPNDDGVNDTFEIPGLEFFAGNEIAIMNRWGGTVYESKNYKGDWKGEGLNEGTYFYLLKLQTAEGKWDIYKGYITLLRTKK